MKSEVVLRKRPPDHALGESMRSVSSMGGAEGSRRLSLLHDLTSLPSVLLAATSPLLCRQAGPWDAAAGCKSALSGPCCRSNRGAPVRGRHYAAVCGPLPLLVRLFLPRGAVN